MGDFVSNLAGHFRFLQRPHSIRTRLIWLIAVSVLPLLALSGWLAASRAEAERQVIEARRFDLVNERMVAQSLEGEVVMDFAPEGLSWTLSIPAHHIVGQNQPNTPQFPVLA